MNPRRPLNHERVTQAWDDAQSYKNHRQPVTIHVPLGAYLRFVAIAIPLAVAVMLIWPNP